MGPILRKIFFVFFVFLLFSSVFLKDGRLFAEDLKPPAVGAVLQEDKTWKGYHLQLWISPSQVQPLEPADFFIGAHGETLQKPFSGSVSLSFERISEKSSVPLQETQIGEQDYEESGFAKLTHVFQEPGEYRVRAVFTDPSGELSILQGKIQVNAPAGTTLFPYKIFIAAGGLLLAFSAYFIFRRRSGTQ